MYSNEQLVGADDNDETEYPEDDLFAWLCFFVRYERPLLVFQMVRPANWVIHMPLEAAEKSNPARRIATKR